MLQSRLLCDMAQFTADDQILVLNSAADPFVTLALRRLQGGRLILAEDNVATLRELPPDFSAHFQAVPFHDYLLNHPAATSDVAVMNLLYQLGNVWIWYGLSIAAHALKPGGRLYVSGAKDRGIMTIARRLQELFGNVETLTISKGSRVLMAVKRGENLLPQGEIVPLRVFADGKLDEGTRLLLEALEVKGTDHALDIGCGAGIIGLHIARHAPQGQVTMVDASLAAVAASRQAVQEAGLTNVQVLPGDGAQAVISQHFDLVATNPPFHQGGIQTLEIAQRFIRESAQVLLPKGRLYLVANRFLKYEPTLVAHFKQVEEVHGDSRYKVLRAIGPLPKKSI